jgi:small subunit ribosomal protein S11
MANNQSQAAPKKAKKARRAVSHARVYIRASFNNTIVTITDTNGDALAAASAGGCGFRGTRKATPYAAQIAAETAMQRAKVYGIEKVDVFLRGLGVGRDQALRGVLNENDNIDIQSIVDWTPRPHGGCRKRKARRV